MLMIGIVKQLIIQNTLFLKAFYNLGRMKYFLFVNGPCMKALGL